LRSIRSRNGILEAGPFRFLGIWAQQGTNAFTVNACIGARARRADPGERQLAHREGGGMMACGSALSGSIARLFAAARAMRGGKKQIFDRQ